MKKLISIWKNASVQVKASIVFLVATLLTKGMTFITTPIFTRIMSENDMGIVGTYNSWKAIYEVLATLALVHGGVFNVGMSKHQKDRNQYVSSILWLCITTASISGLTLLSVLFYIKKIIGIPRSLIILMIIQTILIPGQTFWLTKQRYEFKYKAAFIISIGNSIIGQLMAVLAVYFNNNNLPTIRLWAENFPTLIVSFILCVILTYKGKKIFNKGIWKNESIFAITLIPHYLASIVLTSSDRIMVASLDSLSNAGIYTVVYGVATIGTIVWNAIQSSLTPTVYEKLNSDKLDGIDVLANNIVLIFGIISILISLLGPEVIRIMGPKSYGSGAYVIPPIVGAIFISCLYNLFSMIEFYHNKGLFITFASVTAGILNIVLNFIFIPKFGYVAAGYTTLVTYCILSILHYINMRRIEKRKIYNNKNLFIICLVVLVICICTSFLYKYIVLRYLIIIALLAITIYKKNIIREVLMKK